MKRIIPRLFYILVYAPNTETEYKIQITYHDEIFQISLNSRDLYGKRFKKF